ncbi:uncharacterized protein KY384_008452 [Bacidia gigantensis]|uniref:uncharacterized protein n=1 Tax=Bacidia gigantensis TaxID=2732470 RepID=UPI001D03AA46|nr:uncharacterized protein KY384_008452 [Bacidia gigantensis]KAG8527023.1 hypothetical protein KY384_008452 [Bacidia gigantensis]
MSMITAVTWVPRGAAAAFPTKYDVDEQELARISKLAKLQLDDAKEDLEDSKAQGAVEQGSSVSGDSESEDAGVNIPQSKIDADSDLAAYDLDHYDDDDEAPEVGGNLSMLGNARSLAYYETNEEDPYIKLTETQDEDDEEREELQILPTDSMILAAKVEDEVPYLEVYVYEDEADNLYVHHDIMLPAIPLCVEWLDLPVGKGITSMDDNSRGNFAAVGTMDPDIELWDLDTIDSMYLNAILGQGNDHTRSDPSPEGKKKRKPKKSKKANDQYHVDAVLALAANRQHRNLLASSSADNTIKLWDLTSTKCAKSYSYHTDKVCSIAWHPREPTVLLSGSYDRRVIASDLRAADANSAAWGVESDVEAVLWDSHDPNYFFVTTEKGILHMNDIRNRPARPGESKSVWTLQAHDEAVSSIDINPVIPGFVATGSSDKEVKLWNVQPTGCSMIVSRNVGVGRVFSTKFGPDPEVAFRLGVAGSKGSFQVWDTSTNGGVRRVFGTRVSHSANTEKIDRTVGMAEDSSDDEDQGGTEPGGEDGMAGNGWESADDDER